MRSSGNRLIDDATRQNNQVKAGELVTDPDRGSGPGAFVAVNWRTGEVRAAERPLPDLFAMEGGRAVSLAAPEEVERMETTGSPKECSRAYHPREDEVITVTEYDALEVTDVATGNVLLTVDGLGGYPYAALSPDGSHAIVAQDSSGGTGFEVYDVDSGSHVTVEGTYFNYGWTAAGDLFGVDTQGVHSCDADTGACTTAPLPQGDDCKSFRFPLPGGLSSYGGRGMTPLPLC